MVLILKNTALDGSHICQAMPDYYSNIREQAFE